MRCSDFKVRLNELLDERRAASDDLELSRHAHECPVCAKALEIGVCLANLWSSEPNASNPHTAWPDDLTSASNASVESRDLVTKRDTPTSTNRSSARRLFGLLTAMAAGVAITVAMWSVSNTPPAVVDSAQEPSPAMVAQTSGVQALGSTKTEPQLPATEPSSLITAVPPSMVRQTDASAFVHQPLISIGILSRQEWDYPMDEVPNPFGTALQIEPRWIEVVSNGMAPVQSSVSKTIDAIRRSLSS